MKESSLGFSIEEEEEDSQPWLMTYADLFTLLFAFFVLIAASGSVDQGKFDEIRESASSSLNETESNEVLKELKQARETREMFQKKVTDLIKDKDLQDSVSFQKNKKGLKVTFPSKILFTSGSATLEPSFKIVLEEIVAILKTPEYKEFRISVEGHSDDVPISTLQYPSNWELSASRAASVVNYMTASGYNKTNVKVSGYADSRPLKLVDIQMTKEEKIKARKKNRRIEIQIIYYKDQF